MAVYTLEIIHWYNAYDSEGVVLGAYSTMEKVLECMSFIEKKYPHKPYTFRIEDSELDTTYENRLNRF
ncbi:MAG: hypothetical protein MN733_35505 [Nitrososphaera sp.]|nr:hypothetical protein [Nitrososphaera sp.]